MPKQDQQAATATRDTSTATATRPSTAKPRQLPLYKVILHNDDVNYMDHVVETIVMLTPLNEQDAVERALEANDVGCALLLVIHKERAELYAEQFRSRSLIVSIEPDE